MIISTHSEEMLSDNGISGEEVLRLEPSSKGTLLKSPNDSDDERSLLKSGMSVGEVVIPKAAPKGIDQLLLTFPD